MDDYTLEGTLDTVEYALLNLIRHYPVLYNQHDPGHRDKSRKDTAWAEIARQLNRDEGWCYNKWQNLRDYYRKRKKIYESGAGLSRRWIYYDAMSFLDPFESSSRDSSSGCTVGFVAASELSSGSSRSAHDHGGGHGQRSESSHEPNYFDETQYHGLDGIAERVEVKLSHFLDPLVEQQCPPGAKRQRIEVTQASTPPSRPSSTVTQSRPYFETLTHSEPPPSIVSVQSRAPAGPPAQKNKATTTQSLCTQQAVGVNVNLDADCPHHHFCMSLASRFRRMDPAIATYAQMKIMEVILKAEFPETYKARMSPDKSSSTE